MLFKLFIMLLLLYPPYIHVTFMFKFEFGLEYSVCEGTERLGGGNGGGSNYVCIRRENKGDHLSNTGAYFVPTGIVSNLNCISKKF